MTPPSPPSPEGNARHGRPRAPLWAWLLLGIGGVILAALALQPAKRALVVALSDDYAGDPDAEVAPSYEAPATQRIAIDLQKVADGLAQPTDIQFPPGIEGYAFVAEKGGTLRVLRTDNGAHRPVLAVDVLTASEQGLLGIACHPRFVDNGRLFLNYVQRVDGSDVSRVAEYRVEQPRRPASGKIRLVRTLMDVEQPYANHNAGQLAFGPDGLLYIGWGDGGLRDDPERHGQNLGTLKGSMLRIDVDRRAETTAYAVPKDNPFVNKPGARAEIWAYGLRNPWRFSFDPEGRLIVADVGQDTWEEISVVRPGDNLGWNIREGFACAVKDRQACGRTGFVDPVFVYGRKDGASITGGYVYTGRIEALRGLYVFADFVSGRTFALRLPADRSQRVQRASALGRWPLHISAFGRDHAGELYLAAFGRGEIYKLSEKLGP